METAIIQWQALQGEWLVQRPGNPEPLQLAQWAETLPDLTPVRLVLAAQNYATHWLSLPGVSARHLERALPFALEEALIDDVGDYLIVPAGSHDKRHRAYVVSDELVERLLEACELHHLQVRELLPETALLGSGALIVRSQDGWLFSLPGVFEGYVSDQALTPVLESLFDSGLQLESLQLQAPALAPLQLLQTLLESSFPDQIGSISTQVISAAEPLQLNGKPQNLLTGRYQVRIVREDKPPVWWRPLAGLAAAWLLLWTLSLFGEVQTLRTQAAQVQQQSISLYKSLFPGERVRSLERQFREKLNGSSEQGQAGFVSSTRTLAQVYHQSGLQKQIQMTSLRFNDRLQELTVELRASSLAELQTLRQGLEKAGLQAEIASATNDKDGVKGRIRIGGQA